MEIVEKMNLKYPAILALIIGTSTSIEAREPLYDDLKLRVRESLNSGRIIEIKLDRQLITKPLCKLLKEEEKPVEIPSEERILLCKKVINQLIKTSSSLDNENQKIGVRILLNQALMDLDRCIGVERFYTVDYLEVFMKDLSTKISWELCANSLPRDFDPFVIYKIKKNVRQLSCEDMYLGYNHNFNQGMLGSCTVNFGVSYPDLKVSIDEQGVVRENPSRLYRYYYSRERH